MKQGRVKSQAGALSCEARVPGGGATRDCGLLLLLPPVLRCLPAGCSLTGHPWPRSEARAGCVAGVMALCLD